MKVYFDASALVALATDQPAKERLAAWQDEAGPTTACMSDFGRGELVSGLARLARMNQLSGEAVVAALHRFDAGPFLRIGLEASDIAEATTHVCNWQLGLRLPDAIHIAIARRIEASLLTFDRHQHDAAKVLGIAVTGPLAGDRQ